MAIRKLLGCMVIVTAALIPSVSYARTGNELLLIANASARVDTNQKHTQKDYSDATYFMGLMLGTLYFIDESVCIPDAVNSGQLGLVVHKYMKDHPEILHYDEQIIIRSAVSQAYPCPKK